MTYKKLFCCNSFSLCFSNSLFVFLYAAAPSSSEILFPKTPCESSQGSTLFFLLPFPLPLFSLITNGCKTCYCVCIVQITQSALNL
uniref:Secreted protein n=1 Tax=Sinocyclocheilus rhinocerous TaxID=307959 RepID=A0A673KW31_9TELE